MGEQMLRITIHETDDEMAIRLEGRVAGPWVAELGHAWAEATPHLASRQVVLDLRDVTFADLAGKQVLRDIHSQTGARLVASTQWSQFLAGEISGDNSGRIGEEPSNESIN
jgi:anti-anti-sigma regulatory factor